MQNKINRRSFVGGAALGATSILGGALNQALAANAKDGSAQGPVANTTSGKVRGVVQENKVNAFRGIPYGAPTGGADRFMPPVKPEAWTGIKETVEWGPEAPQGPHTEIPEVAATIPKLAIGEDCLHLNVWTNGLDSRKRPVMLWLHGGGFASGNGSYSMYDGANMARKHDVVTVTINHRLNSFGFLYLADIGGEKFKNATNCGMLDAVAALEWVRDNIANFGGDPNRVMIYGQSGGGSKVTTLLGMPSAVGLIHRASIQSGGGGNPPGADASREFARQVMSELNLGPRDIASLQKMEWAKLNAAANAVALKMNGPLPAGRGPGSPTGAPRVGSGPTVDGRIITIRSFNEAIADSAKNIPILIGSVSEEGNSMGSRPTEEQWRATLARVWGDAKGKTLADAMIKKYPKKSIRLLSYGVNGISSRNNVTRMATLKSNQRGAPIYAYYFTWQSPMLEDAGAWHTAELAFCFDNTKRCEQGTGNTIEAQALARKMATAWANHAKTGNPSQPGLVWTPFDPAKCSTMVWDNECRMVNDPEGDLRKILLA